MAAKHTAGEWHAKDGQIYPIETGKTLATIPYFDPENDEQEANQKLISAAPDLLEALQTVLNWAKNGNQEDLIVFQQAQTAIQKATI